MGGIERFGLPKQGGVPASQAVKADGWLFVAGQVPKNAEGEFVVGGIAEQARQTAHRKLLLRIGGVGIFSILVIALAVVLIRKLHKAGKC